MAVFPFRLDFYRYFENFAVNYTDLNSSVNFAENYMDHLFVLSGNLSHAEHSSVEHEGLLMIEPQAP